MDDSSHNHDGIQLDRVVFFGRTLPKYVKFFNLDLSDWHSKILDCPSGAASFVAEAHQMGIDGVACDLLFHLDPKVIIEKGKTDYDLFTQKL